MKVGFVGVITPTPTAHFGAGAISKLGGIVRATGSEAAVVVTDQALAATPVVASVTSALAGAGRAAGIFTGVRPNPVTADLAAGADAVAQLWPGCGGVALVGGRRRVGHRRGQGHRARCR
jgi:alcohol dehydrogenase class IV